MKLTLFITALAIVLSSLSGKENPVLPQGFVNNTGRIKFIENKGQVYDQNYKPRTDVLYSTLAGNMTVHIKNNGVSYQLYRVNKYKEVEDPKTKEKRKEIDQQTIYRIDLNWLNANKNFTESVDETMPGYDNYYLESCPNGVLNVKSYKGITLSNLYNGINLHYYEKDGQLKYDYIVAPHSDYKQIQIETKGADVSINKDGSLLLNTPLGKVLEGTPVVFQQGKRLKANWLVKNNILSFEIKNYNPNYELIIDPITRIWGTYYGGISDDIIFSCRNDASSNVYLGGYTSSNNATAIATTGAYQIVLGGIADAILVKFNSAGVRQWGTYYGGAGGDYGYSCSTDASGNVNFVGQTASTGTVLASTGTHQTNHNGGTWDAFLVQFNASGIRQWGTYYGGSGDDWGLCSCTDAYGNTYLTAGTTSSVGTNIATPGSYQSVIGGGTGDAYLVKFNSVGVRQWGTYYGGAGGESGQSCCTDASGNIYLVGQTDSNTGTLIATIGSHQSTYGGGTLDAFLVKFNNAGQRQWATYYGGTGDERGYCCATDTFGNVYLAGETGSNTGTIVASPGSHQSIYGGGFNDAFLVKFDSTGKRQWGTYYGDVNSDYGQSCFTDIKGNIYLSGYTSSNTGTAIATIGSHQSTYGGGTYDSYLVKFNSSGFRQWGTYYGGSAVDYCFSGSGGTDTTGNVYLSGCTGSASGTVIASSGVHQSTYGGGNLDAFLARFKECTPLNPIAIVNSTFCASANINFITSITGTVTPTYNWNGPNTFTSNLQNPSIIGAGTVNTGVYTVTINNQDCIETSTAQVTVYPNPTITVNSGSICSGNSFTIAPVGASIYTIQGGNSVVSPTTNTSYTVIGSTAGCVSNVVTSSVTVNSLPLPTITATTSNSVICGPPYQGTATINASGASTYIWNTSATGSSISVTPSVTTTYTVTGTNANGCTNSTTITQSVSACTDINEQLLTRQEFLVFPNPNNGEFIISLNSLKEPVEIEIYNNLGQIILIKHLTELNSKINMGEYANGVYILKLCRHNSSPLVKELIKQ